MHFLTRQIDRLPSFLSPLRSRLGPFFWGAGVVFTIQRGADVANLIIKIILGRILSPLDFGAIDPIYGTVAIIGLPATIIFSAAVKSISRLLAQEREAHCRSLIQHLMLLALAGSVISVLLALSLKGFILTRLHLKSTTYIWAIGLLFSTAWWLPLANALLRAKLHYRYLILPRIVSPLALVILTILFVRVFGLGLKGAVFARGAEGLVTLLIVAPLMFSMCIGPKASYADERKILLRVLGPMAIFVLVSTLGLHFDRLFVRNFLVEHSGGYAAILTLGQIPTLLIAPIVFVTLPIASAEYASGQQLDRLYRHAMSLAAVGTVGATVFFTLVAQPLLQVWQPDFLPYAKYVWVYTLATGLLAMLNVSAQIEIARHAYGFLWAHAIPILGFCGLLYVMQNKATLIFVLSGLVISRATALTLVMLHIRFRRH
jgi:O-antigen/teichoic acid export membrane protein